VFVLEVSQNSLIDVLLIFLRKKMLKKWITKDAFSMYFDNLYLLILNLNFAKKQNNHTVLNLISTNKMNLAKPNFYSNLKFLNFCKIKLFIAI